jgi:hypothetical protein
MLSKFTRYVAVALAVALWAVAAAAAQPTLDPKPLVVDESDLPRGIQLKSRAGYYISASDFGRQWMISPAAVRKLGFVGGYLSSFEETHLGLVVYSQSLIFRSEKSAALLARAFRRECHGGVALSRTNIGIGADICVRPQTRMQIAVYTITWHRGRTVGRVLAFGGRTTKTFAIALAHGQDARTAAALRRAG